MTSPTGQGETPASVKWSVYLAFICAGACSWNVIRHDWSFLGAALFWGAIWLVGNLLLFFLGYLRGR